MEATRANQAYCVLKVLYMALELSVKKWVVLFSDGVRRRQVTVDAGDRTALLAQIGLAKARLKLAPHTPVVSCYEAGRDGFWLHRWLASVGVDNCVVDPASIEVPQHAKRVKTDRVDVHKLMDLLVRWHGGGERRAWRVVRVPSVHDEDQRQLQRERARLLGDVTRAGNRIGSLLATQGLRLALNKGFTQALAQLRCWDGTALPVQLRAAIEQEWLRRELAGRQLAALQAQQRRRLSQPAADDVMAQQAKQLMQLYAVGVQSGWLLSAEIFAWREIHNRRQLGALAGFTPTPYASGQSQREQGISKAGNARVRKAMIELAWLWLRWQGASALSQWYQRRFGSTGSTRSRRIGIVALARRLLVALWRYLEQGVIPEGAVLKTA